MDGSRIPMVSPTKRTSIGLPRVSDATSSKLRAPQVSVVTNAPSMSPTKPLLIGKPIKSTLIPSPKKFGFTPSATTPAPDRTTSVVPAHLGPPSTKTATRRPMPTSTKTTVGKVGLPCATQPSKGAQTRREESRPYSRLASKRPDLAPPKLVATPKPQTKVRSSLSDRTVESLSRLPSTPASARRTSSFFRSESPTPGPVFAVSRTPVIVRSTHTASRSRLPATKLQTSQPHSSSVTKPSSIRPRRSNSVAQPTGLKLGSGMQSIPRRPSSAMSSMSGRQVTSRLGFRSITPEPASIPEAVEYTDERPSSRDSILSNDSRLDSLTDIHTRFAATSAALRGQIAQVRARGKFDQPSFTPGTTKAVEAATSVLPSDRIDVGERIHTALVYGHLDLSGMGLQRITDEIRNMYDEGHVKDDVIRSGNCVELSGLTLNNNDIEVLCDTDFPDDVDHPTQSCPRLQLAGLERFSLRSNHLQSLPLGLRRLPHLSTLDLSHNCLGNGSFDILCQITSLKHLNLSNNKLSGHVPEAVFTLTNLKSLDLSGNKLLSLPQSLSELKGLRVLNVSANQLTGVPTEVVQISSLIEINAASNSLVGAFFSFGTNALSGLKALDVSNNALASLAFSENVSLPALQSLNISGNHMISLPDISGWKSLKVLSAAGNQISELPTGLTALKQLCHIDMTNNNLQEIDSRVSEMAQLKEFLVARNPLVRCNLGSLSAEAIKHALASQSPAHTSKSADRHCSSGSFDDEAIDVRSQASADHFSPWKITRSGIVNLESKELLDEDADCLRAFLGMNHVRELSLAKNKFTQIPTEIALAQSLQVLDLSDCALSENCLTESMHLPCLQTLRLSGNAIRSMDSLKQHLLAPKLEVIEMAGSGAEIDLQNLREVFPVLERVVV